MDNGLKKVAKSILYAESFLAIIPSMIMLTLGLSNILESPFFKIGILIISLSVFTLIALKNSDKTWGKYFLLIITILAWFGFFGEILIEKKIVLGELLIWTIPLTVFVYLNFRN